MKQNSITIKGCRFFHSLAIRNVGWALRDMPDVKDNILMPTADDAVLTIGVFGGRRGCEASPKTQLVL